MCWPTYLEPRFKEVGDRMMDTSKTLVRGLMAATVLAAALAAPAAATPATDGDSHKVTICHVTNSATNPWVEITIDVAAFDGEGKNDHAHHVAKDGRKDFIPVDGNCDADATDGDNPYED